VYLLVKWLSGILTTVLSGWILHDRLIHRLRSWSWHFLNSDISQGSVVMQLRYGEINSQGFVANLLVNLSVKEVWKSVNIWRSYGQYCSALFCFDSQCRWSAYVTSKSPKGWLKKRTFPFLNKTQLQLNEVCYKVSLTKNFKQQSFSTIIPLSNGPKFSLEVTHPLKIADLTHFR